MTAAGDDERPVRSRRVPAHREGREPVVRVEPPMPSEPGARRLVQASIIGTVAFVVTSVPAAIAPDAFVGVAVAVSLVLFALGVLAFLAAYAVAVGRSRTDLIGIGGLFFLAGGVAPRVVQRCLMACLVVQVVVGVATASSRVYTPLAFGVLVPMYGLGVMGLWGARFGTFPPRPSDAA